MFSSTFLVMVAAAALVAIGISIIAASLARARRLCAACGHQNEPGAHYCGRCGRRLGS